MLRFKLKLFLEQHGLTAYQLAQAVEELDEQTIFAYARGSRTPRLDSLDLLIGALRDLTGLEVGVADLLEYHDERADEREAPPPASRTFPGDEVPTPGLIGPEGLVHEVTPGLRLQPVPGATRYAFFVRNVRDNRYLVENALSDGPVYHLPVPLGPGERYVWSARAHGSQGWSSFSSPLVFTVVPSAGPDASLVKLAPPVPVTTFSETDSTTPTLSVEAGDSANWYGFYIRDLGRDALVYDNDYAAQASIDVPAGILVPGGRYRWNARVRNAAGWSDFCPRTHFTVAEGACPTRPPKRPRLDGVLGHLRVSAEPQMLAVTGEHFVPSSRVAFTSPSGKNYPVPPGLTEYKGEGALELSAVFGEAGAWRVQVVLPDGTPSAFFAFSVKP
jgi:transcriptional regulator with XRE-family HTH domain